MRLHLVFISLYQENLPQGSIALNLHPFHGPSPSSAAIYTKVHQPVIKKKAQWSLSTQLVTSKLHMKAK
jgi:hypothetical protein